MIIVGNGVDIVENSRIKKSKLKTDKVSYFAKRFAAKEAFVKSLGTGFRKGINFSDISVVNDKLGKPFIKINDKIKSIILKKNRFKSFKIFLSLSDQDKHSIAFVILSGLKE